jgi:Tfp pilus assembly protein PilX
MIGQHRTKSRASERGVALIVALLTLLLISAILMGMIVASSSETNISTNFRDEQTAFFAARAGIEEIRDRMRPSATTTLATTAYFTAATTPLPGAVNGVLYVTNPTGGETVAPWLTTGTNYPDDEICKEVTCVGGVPAGAWTLPAQSASATYAATPVLNWKWVRIMIKPNKSDTGLARVTSVDGLTNGNRVCFNGTNEHTTALTSCPDKPVYELTALAVTKSGSRRMVQYEISQSTFPTIPGAMVFDGPTPVYGAPNSNAFGVSGTDVAQGPNAGVGCPTPQNQPAVGGYDNASVATLVADIPKPAKYTSGATPTPAVSNVNAALGPLGTVDGLTALVNSITASANPANVYGNNPTIANLGTDANPVINVVNGDLSMGPSTGAGILLVTGNLTLSGNPSYNGIILVIGKGTFTKNGGGNGTLNGALLVANLNDSSGNPIPLGSNHAPGIPSMNWNGGGNFTGQYDSCWINYMSQSLPYRTITDRELIY